MPDPERNLQTMLEKIYGDKPPANDPLGKRPATPVEIDKALHNGYTEADFIPTQEDIEQKNDD